MAQVLQRLGASGYTLQTYVTQVQRLLHDPNADFWSISQLTDYINTARSHVVLDTQCLRTVATYALTANVDRYDAQTVLSSTGITAQVLAIVDIFWIWSTDRIPLRNMAYTQLNREARPWTNYQSFLLGWARQGQTGVVIGPLPDQSYSTEWDLIYAPLTLSALADSEVDLVYPQTEPVSYYAAYLARLYEEDIDRAQQMMSLYRARIKESQSNFVTMLDPSEDDVEVF